MSSSRLIPTENSDRFERLGRFFQSNEDRDRYLEWMEYARHIPKTDEILRLLDVLELLTVLTRETPEAIAAEREALANILAENRDDLAQLQTATAAYKKEIEERLAKLPPELAKAIEPQKVAQQLATNLKQEFINTGMEEIRQRLAVVVERLEPVAAGFELATEQFFKRYRGFASEAERECNQLIESTAKMRRENERLLVQSKGFNNWWMVALAVLVFLGGLMLGHTWEARDFSSSMTDVQQRLDQIQGKLNTGPSARTLMQKRRKE